MEYQKLIKKLENLEYNLDDHILEFTPVLHNLYLKNNSKDLKKLTESFAGYLFKKCKNRFKKEGYDLAFLIAIEDIDDYSEQADKMHSLKTFKDEIGPIQDFYRDSVDYFQQETFSNLN